MPTELAEIGDGVASYRRNFIKRIYNSGQQGTFMDEGSSYSRAGVDIDTADARAGHEVAADGSQIAGAQ